MKSTLFDRSPAPIDTNGFIRSVEGGLCIDAVVEQMARVHIDSYVPLVCAAIHDGHALRSALARRCLLTEEERLYEEDPHSGELIQAMPITIIALDSRYEYDLNRPRAQCVYSEAWGKKVWRQRLPASELQRSRDKHRAFYVVLDTLIQQLETRFGGCLIIDLHSFNHQRIGPEAPTFNIGTSQMDLQRYGAVIRQLEQALSRVELPNLKTRVVRDEVFQGRGYLAAHANAHYENSLVIPLEIAKVFMDEGSGELFPLVFETLSSSLKQVFSHVAAAFSLKHARSRLSRVQLLPRSIDPSLAEVDARLFKISRHVETLRYINPININAEKRRFLGRHGQCPPAFRYRQLDIDPYRFRENIYRLPISRIQDPDIQALYRGVVDMLATRVELITTLGTDHFLYNSLRYYGEPSDTDLATARFLLHAPPVANPRGEPVHDPRAARDFFVKRARDWGLSVRVELSDRLAAKAMFQRARGALLVNRNVRFSDGELEALAHHELGLHLVTTLNARVQPLRVFGLGLPGNTEAQEGLAVLCEHLSGNLTHKRLQTLAYRVIAVRAMIRHNDFCRTFDFLCTEHNLDHAKAFGLCVRVYRGGGFTKDYLYLRGLRRTLELHRKRGLDPLLAGKMGFAQLELIDELLGRGLIKPPRFRPPGLEAPQPTSELIDYLLSGIR